MNPKSQSDSLAKAVRDYVERITVPVFDRNAVERRTPQRARVEKTWMQYVVAALVLLGLAAWAAPALPALVADVQNVMQLFLERNGQLVPATNRTVTIEQAMRDLPFRVIPPNGVPLAVVPMIQEVNIPGDPQSAQLFVQYSSNAPGPKPGLTAMPALTIVETAASAPEEKLAFAVHPDNVPPMRPPNPVPYRQGTVEIRALVESWISNGTRVRLLGTPGQITQAQLESIRHAMGG